MSTAGLTPLHLAILHGRHDELRSLLAAKTKHTVKTTEMVTSHPRARDARVFRPASATFYPPDPIDDIGPNRAFDKGSQPLHMAASIGDEVAVGALLDARARVGTRDGVGATALHLAALGGHHGVVLRLLEAGADLHATTRTRKSIRFYDVGTTPLMAALESGRAETVQHLLSLGADPTATTKDDIGTPLFAARGGSTECLELLVSAGVSMTEPPSHFNNPLLVAVEGGHLEFARRLLRLDAPSESDRGHQAPLRAAIRRNDLAMRQMLLDEGVRPLPDHGIESAIRGNDLTYLQQWLAAGHDVNAAGTGEHLRLAAALGHLPLVDCMLNHGAQVDAHSGHGTPLHVALGNRHFEVASRLLQHPQDCTLVDEHGNTVLMKACMGHADLGCVERILAMGGNPHTVNRHGVSLMARVDETREPRLFALLSAVSPEGAADHAWRAPERSHVLESVGATYDWKAMHQALWTELVPPSHEADTVQGELVRCISNLADEAYRNGNRNWDERHVAMVDFLLATLVDGTLGEARDALLTRQIRSLRNHRQLGNTPHDAIHEAVVDWCVAHPTLQRR